MSPMSRRQRIATSTVLVALVVAAGMGVAARSGAAGGDDPRLTATATAPRGASTTTVTIGVAERSVIRVEPPTTTPSITSTTTTTPSTTTLPPLPVPEPLPEDPYAADPHEPIGRIAIPAIGLDWDLGQGMTLTEIDRGPAHWPGTALPGELGNVVVAGHRTTWGAPFRHLDALEPGNEIVFTTEAGESVYVVTETFVVEAEDVWIADQERAHMATLFACHPVGSAAQRIVIRAELAVPDTDEEPRRASVR